MNKNRTRILAGIIVLALVAWIFRPQAEGASGTDVLIDVQQGVFEVQVTTSGELQAKKSTKIMGPSTLRNAGIWQVQIESLIPEGTVVKTGDVVAQLNRSELTGKIQEAELNLQKVNSQFVQTQLDCTLTLSLARDELVNQKFQLEERKIAMEQSQFEAPSVQRQAQLDYEKALRGYQQSSKNYATKVKQAEAKIAESGTDLTKQQNRLNDFKKILDDFVVMAPGNGMVIYIKDWDGRKIASGSQINVWNPVVAELPDLTKMMSKTYVNEIDIKKITVGQEVRIGLDADPARKYTGKVTSVANIGEQRPNSDSKVFEVLIDVNETDSLARPSMTTSNTIIVSSLADALFVPLEAVYPGSKDGLRFSYVFKKDGSKTVRQQVEIAEMNDVHVRILQGLQKSERVFLTLPADTADMRWSMLEKPLTQK